MFVAFVTTNYWGEPELRAVSVFHGDLRSFAVAWFLFDSTRCPSFGVAWLLSVQ